MAARAKKEALEKETPKLQIVEDVVALTVPGHAIGQTEGVARNSEDHLFVYSRTGSGGTSRGSTAAELFEFDQNLKIRQALGSRQLRCFFRARGSCR